MPKYVIVGGSVAAISAVEAIREVDPAGTIAIVAEEPFPTYSRPMIGDYVSGEATWDMMMYRSDRFWSENKVEAFIGSRAARLNFAGRFVETDEGKRVEYEKLLLATGSEPLIPKIDGSNRRGVFTFIRLADAENLKAKCEKAEKAVVVGGGLIGVCAADALTEVGAKVTIVELK
jgi:NAD(P)H-nitrite reductase large subunit